MDRFEDHRGVIQDLFGAGTLGPLGQQRERRWPGRPRDGRERAKTPLDGAVLERVVGDHAGAAAGGQKHGEGGQNRSERVEFVKSLRCVVFEAVGCSGPMENVHVRGDGAGRKADARWVVPMCHKPLVILVCRW